jgi:hypothetical protein
MEDKFPNDSKSATAYFLEWMQKKKIQEQENPRSFKREPGLYIGGLKCMPGDTLVTDNHGLPHIIRAGCCG